MPTAVAIKTPSRLDQHCLDDQTADSMVMASLLPKTPHSDILSSVTSFVSPPSPLLKCPEAISAWKHQHQHQHHQTLQRQQLQLQFQLQSKQRSLLHRQRVCPSPQGTRPSSPLCSFLLAEPHQVQQHQPQEQAQNEGEHHQQGPPQQSRDQVCSADFSSSEATAAAPILESALIETCSSSKRESSVDLVDDIWRMVFYFLATDCKDLGRMMQVNRRFQSLIEEDAALWRLAYKLTVAGSIFASQRPLRSPMWFRDARNQPVPGCSNSSLASSSTVSALAPSSPTPPSSLVLSSSSLPLPLQDRSESTQEFPRPCTPSFPQGRRTAMLSSVPPASHVRGHEQDSSSSSLGNFVPRDHCAEQHGFTDGLHRPSTLEAYRGLDGSRQHQKSTLTGGTGERPNMGIAPGLLMPSPLVLPHHRRIIETISMHTDKYLPSNSLPALVSSSNPPISDSALLAPTPISSNTTPLPPSFASVLVDRSFIPETPAQKGAMMTVGPTRTPASTPVSFAMPSFQSTLPSTLSQVLSSSTTPLSMIQHHIPTTTLMHHPPAVYWKHQVVDWLEQEKLRCLRLGLFWGMNNQSSRTHGGRRRQ